MVPWCSCFNTAPSPTPLASVNRWYGREMSGGTRIGAMVMLCLVSSNALVSSEVHSILSGQLFLVRSDKQADMLLKLGMCAR